MTKYGASARGIATITEDGTVLDTWFADPVAQESQSGGSYTHKLTPDDLNSSWEDLIGLDSVREVEKVPVETVIGDLDQPPVDTYDAYLRLHLLSHRVVKPNTINLNNLTQIMPKVVWTNYGACPINNFEKIRMKLRIRGPVIIHSIDHIPQMLDFVMPSGVRIADPAGVRLGAYLAEGTTVTASGFVDYNAGTLGVSSVEGRISQGVTVSDNSDIGGGASVMGPHAGAEGVPVKIGERCLLGANSGLGIPLGNDCVVEAGLYITPGTKILNLLNDEPSTIHAVELGGQDNILFRRNSITGAVEAVPYGKVDNKLN